MYCMGSLRQMARARGRPRGSGRRGAGDNPGIIPDRPVRRYPRVALKPCRGYNFPVFSWERRKPRRLPADLADRPSRSLHEVPMFARDMQIAGFDAELAEAIANERRRQEDHVELIASENYASPRVLE